MRGIEDEENGEVLIQRSTIKGTKRRATDGEKILVKHIYDKRLLYKTYKEYLKVNSKKINPIKKWAKDLLTKEDIQM